ncbi:Rieske 2Fe-2S domain-containing protein [Sediminitomix flava]|uniref:Nitrite reductase/ring-hydroxylating ferredoxin subunit n=1 Tax=Sediminitomix flava TaxID=379075 RepID=A0A315ZHN7_SEDFL|nr:Rieske 2Fe-2S domain-containing protein [Sediminitomix flava]PWJ44723.1 nitrite reductase/ring-hydroxylating ferredoxin subunit [Sediminitomix flava]
MSVKYVPVQWNRQKKIYDSILWGGILLFISSYVGFQLLFQTHISLETLIIRATALSAFFLLHLILCIGPLSRLDDRFLPLLYNRRHMGVSMFLLAAIHGIFCIIQFHSLGDTNALVSVFTSNEKYNSISQFPFQVLGFIALCIFFIMAATSHDFWLKNLGPKFWKLMHMLIYMAYGLIIMHVATGAFQYETHPIYWLLLVFGFLNVFGFHLMAGLKEMRYLRVSKKDDEKNNFYFVALEEDIPENSAIQALVEGEDIAIFKYENKISAVSNTCKHQMGPLSEGKIVDGCITCPWHGFQYNPKNGQSPPPFTEKLKTYQLKLIGDEIWIDPKPKAEGTYIEPLVLKSSS